MVRIATMPKDAAQILRTPKQPGVRRQRMNLFDGYAQALLDNPSEAVAYEELDEEPHKFVLSLRGAFKRAGAPAVVRKMRGRDEVRAWLDEAAARPKAVAKNGRRAAEKPTRGGRMRRNGR
ncbi:MAG TPA: hypothetical protein VKQ30_25015 [Ktedonobacterales bacterium]|nr:hypothetical protein [Ktedonobacterales bacterium]